MSILADTVDAVIGVDTHADTHTAAIVAASTGGVLAELTTAATAAGYQQMVAWAAAQPMRRTWALEGTTSYGTGLTRHLQGLGEVVIEVERPNRPVRRRGKSDSIDAVRSAREALASEHPAQPRAGGLRAALAITLAARRSAVDAAADAQRQLRSTLITAPEPLRARFRDMTATTMITTAARLRPQPSWDIETYQAATIIKALAGRIKALRTEAADHHHTIEDLVRSWRPELLEVHGVGPITAATLLCAWSHPGRIRSDAAFASLAGVAPLDASSGRHQTHRLNRRGDRQLNRALHTIAICRLRTHPTTRAYAERRRSEPNMTDPKIRRCIKRYIARELYNLLEAGPAAP